MIRGVIAARVFNKVNERSITNVDDSSALTLMSSDVERIMTGLNVIHETWANIIEAAIGIILLEQQISHTALISLGVALSESILQYFTHLCRFDLFTNSTRVCSCRCRGWCSSIHSRYSTKSLDGSH